MLSLNEAIKKLDTISDMPPLAFDVIRQIFAEQNKLNKQLAQTLEGFKKDSHERGIEIMRLRGELGIKTKAMEYVMNGDATNFNELGLDTSLRYSSTNTPMLVGDMVKFYFNDFYGEVEGMICFQNGSFGAVIIKHEKLKGVFIPISGLWVKILDNTING